MGPCLVVIWTVLHRVTDAFSMSVLMNTGSAIFFMLKKWLMTGGRVITSAVPIHRWITRHQLNSKQTGETGNMKKKQPALLTEGCIKSCRGVRYTLIVKGTSLDIPKAIYLYHLRLEMTLLFFPCIRWAWSTGGKKPREWIIQQTSSLLETGGK